jgi:tripartite-type tricarboxylate transporter receptor subunit TctC
MKLLRRQFLHLAAGAAALPVTSRIAWAQSYPTRPVRIIVGFPPGGSFDIAARIIAQWLSDRLGQPFVVENRTGAGGNLAGEAVARASPDGYTLFLFGAVNAVNASLVGNGNFDFLRDIRPVAGVARAPFVMLVNPSFPAENIPEFVAYAKANPNKINFGSGGVGTALHLCGELLNIMVGIHMIHVPYRGEVPAMTDLLGGQVQVVFANLPPALGQITSGRLRPLAVTASVRSDALPNVPTVGEFVAGYEATGWQGIGGPKDLLPEVVQKLNQEINAGLADAKIKERLAEVGTAAWVGTSTEVARFIAQETEKWGKVIRAANIKAE